MLPRKQFPFLLSALLHLVAVVSSSPAPKQYPELKIFGRQASNAICGAGSSRCSNPSVSNFCCPTGTECIAVLDNTAVGCCPTGQDCRIIAPSECGTAAAAASSSQLTKCTNGKCCPPGYLCDGNYCQLQFESWPQTTSSPQPSSSSVPGASNGGNATSLSQAQRQAGFISKDECPAVTIAGFASGFFPGSIVGAALAILIMCFRQRRKENKTRHWSRMPSHRSRKDAHGTTEKLASKSISKHDLTIGYNPEVVVTAPAEAYSGLGITGRHYAVSNTSTQMFAQYDEPDEPTRRGRLRVHGETPPLPSLALGATTDSTPGQSSESLGQSSTGTNTREKKSRKHKRKNSNPSFKDLASTSRFKFRNLLSHENLKEQRGSLASETSVGSSIHSSVFTSSERQSRGNRYPIALQTGANSRSKGPSPVTPTSLRNEITLQRANTTATERTNIEDDYTPITPAFADSDIPQPPHASGLQGPPIIDIPSHDYQLRPQLTSPELHEQYLNIPRQPNAGDRTSMAMTEMTEVDGYKSPFHDRFQYGAYHSEGSEDGYETDGRSVAANSMYPSSFLDIHFDANSPVSPIDNGDARSTYGGKTLREVPSIPSIPPLFQHKNRPLEELARSNSKTKSKGSKVDKLRAASPVDRESCDITVVIDDGRGLSPKWRANNMNTSSPNSSKGIGGAMTGGRYTMQTMQTNKF
ncbi:hypothetical protein H072_8734 [Dactylellina haptotyla CBS 200.50]|uniref:Uncharacterized protein n=1 Tax=Dactylellina haptotyla (strain CBS 200.50) TaxID=1284197 RepID=S8A8X3_DACHA|nr:hypothetical protein H072_8734 [Dactylellina haptotyla CBS 200.50]